MKKSEEYRIWDNLSEKCQSSEYLTNADKESFKNTLLWLRKELGSSFLENVCENDHPICLIIINTAPHICKWVTWFAEELKRLKTQENYSDLLERIKHKNKFNEAHSILESTHIFSKAGFKITIDPQILVKGKPKKPDLKITDEDSHDELFIEVSDLGDSKELEDTDKFINAIKYSFMLSILPLNYRWRVLSVPEDSLRKQIINQAIEEIENAIKKARETNSFQEVTIDGFVEFAVAPEDDTMQLDEWGKEKELGKSLFVGPPILIKEFQRIKDKIFTEIQQLPFDRQGTIIIRVKTSFFYMLDTTKLMDALQEEISRYSSLLALIFIEGLTSVGSIKITESGYHLIIQKTDGNLVYGRCDVVFNPKCKKMVTSATENRIINAFKSL